MAEQREKVVLAYSGGLDTSVAIKWIPENTIWMLLRLRLTLAQ